MGTVKITSRYGILLGFIALLCTIISAGIFFLTKDKIDAVIAAQQRELLLQVIPQDYFNNNLLESAVIPQDYFNNNLLESAVIPQDKNLLGIQKIYFAKKDGNVSAYAYETTAPDGYSGDIRLLVGLDPKGEVLGVRVIEHHETPGLGDKIERRISNWILGFTNQPINEHNLSEWAVKKDGGKFDQFSGATITPRAVVNQTKRSALIMLNNQALLQQLSTQVK
ncbi:TPA: electron transport complex subunit RsxG [Haemophilus influenzae]|uniref:electron transport complex subunit RsxG n=1 Tax=Haemophilus TaxID=724 RepID=UPI000680D5EA|nr:electron transport complex subunit RsxG [Haemophilus influenzae]KMZ24456.1 electron transporter RnfG [Haemophilus influenzae]MCK8807185.1 electron transport complex subunit RsxG [Haemophilus influenzae]MCK9069563.1 electron transport complex subunit RsxG [Haemophilus influenzae]OMP90868.1 electron transport complex subunit G [Haemophilus influenzae]PRI56222.1 Electron transport complex protein RnfG [Haemophilus influenzae]